MPCTEYQYLCLKCGKSYPSGPPTLPVIASGEPQEPLFRLHCDACGAEALLETRYPALQAVSSAPLNPGADTLQAAWQALPFDEAEDHFFRYRYWLPIQRSFAHASLPHWRKSEAVARKFGLEDLDILFSGYYPGSDIRSATFKEFEAYSVFAHIPDSCPKNQVLVVASAGNTARAFAEVALQENLAVLLVVPDVSLPEMNLSLPQNSKVVFVASTHKYDDQSSEYAEAIEVARLLCKSPHFFPEGGVRNVARRCGLGVGYLHAQYSRWLSDPQAPPYRYYFQAIGSGTGAIGSYSMYRRLRQAGCIPAQHQLSLMLAQNAPFIPVVEHWRAGCRGFQPYESRDSLERNQQVVAAVLANRTPPYALVGGLADVLRDSAGDVFAVSNEEVAEMQQLFAAEEGLDLMPAAAVAAAALRQAVEQGKIRQRDEPVLLHLTGGGLTQLGRDFPQNHPIRAAHTVDLSDLQSAEAQQQLLRDVERSFGF